MGNVNRPTRYEADMRESAARFERQRREAALVERKAIIWWLRNAENPGGDKYVAETLADAIEREEHMK